MKKETAGYEWIEIEKDLIFYDIVHHVFCKKNHNSDDVEILHECNERLTDFSNPLTAVKCNNRVFFPPFNSDKLYVYDIASSKFTCIPFEIGKKEDILISNSTPRRFMCGYSYGGKVYFFGRNYKAIMKIDANTLNVEYYHEIEKKIPLNSLKNIENYNTVFGRNYIEYDNNIYIPSGIGSGIWKFSLDISNIEYIKIKSDFNGFDTIAEYNGKILLTASKFDEDRLILWNPYNDKSQIINVREKTVWNRPVVYNNDIYLFPRVENSHILKVNPISNISEKFEHLENLLNNSSNTYYLSVKQQGSSVIFIRAKDNCWLNYNFQSGCLNSSYYRINNEEFLIRFEKKYYDELYSKGTRNYNIINEKEMPLSEFMKRI